MIEIEADTLEEAREQIRSQIPQGLYLLSEHIIADGSPVTTTKELIEIEADTLEEAREQAKSQIPEGHHLLSEQIISDGKPGTVRAFGGTKEAALAKAQGEIPKGASILEIEETPPVRKVIVIAAATEREATLDAMREAHSQFGLDFGVSGNATLKDARLLAVAKKGFFGVGARPAQYEVELLQQPAVCITYKPKAKISCTAGEVSTTKARVSARIGVGVDNLIAELVAIARSDGFLSNQTGGKFDWQSRHIRAREIGATLNAMGGISLMQKAWYTVQARTGTGDTLSYCWRDVGSWQP